MKKLCFILLIAMPVQLWAFDFPSDSMVPLFNFGQKIFSNRDGILSRAFENGVVFDSPTNVVVSETGEKILIIEDNDRLNAIPSVLGNALVVLTTQGYQTVYGNLDNVDVLQDKQNFLKNDSIGSTAEIDETIYAPLIFKIFDTNEKSFNFINPFLLLPAIKDAVSPEIKNIVLVNEECRQFVLSSKTNIPHGTYKFFMETYDTVSGGQNKLCVFDIHAAINGINTCQLTFETISVKDGKAITCGQELSEIYIQFPFFYLGKIKLSQGENKITVTVKDLNKNKAEISLDITAF